MTKHLRSASGRKATLKTDFNQYATFLPPLQRATTIDKGLRCRKAVTIFVRPSGQLQNISLRISGKMLTLTLVKRVNNRSTLLMIETLKAISSAHRLLSFCSKVRGRMLLVSVSPPSHFHMSFTKNTGFSSFFLSLQHFIEYARVNSFIPLKTLV